MFLSSLKNNRLKRCIGIAALVLALTTGVAHADADIAPILAAAHAPPMAQVGAGRLTYMFWDVYDARLYAPDGHYNPDRPFALRLDYLRDVRGQTIAEASAREMSRQGGVDAARLADWRERMMRIFPDVTAGQSLTGLFTPNSATCFYEDTTKIGCIDDPQFGARFFAIWLGDNTDQPDLRRALLGQGS